MTAPTPHRDAVEAARHAWSTEFIPREVVEAAIRSYLAAMEAAGWRMVPREADKGMITAAENVIYRQDLWRPSQLYAAMLSAAPPPEGG